MTDQTSKYHILSQSEGELKKFLSKKSKLHRRWGYYWDEVSKWRRLLFICRVNLERLLNEGGFNSDEGTITVRTVYVRCYKVDNDVLWTFSWKLTALKTKTRIFEQISTPSQGLYRKTRPKYASSCLMVWKNYIVLLHRNFDSKNLY